MTDLAQRIDKLHKAARNARVATHPAQREAAQRFLVQRATDLDAERVALVGQLEAGYRFIEDHPDHLDRNVYENQWIAWVRDYEAIEDALNTAAHLWLDPEAA